MKEALFSKSNHKTQANIKTLSKARSLTYMALGAVLLMICSWISIPIPPEIPFTLQTFAVIFLCAFLGGTRAAGAISIYLLLGALGLPVFSSMRGGAAWLDAGEQQSE